MRHFANVIQSYSKLFKVIQVCRTKYKQQPNSLSYKKHKYNFVDQKQNTFYENPGFSVQLLEFFGAIDSALCEQPLFDKCQCRCG